MFSSVYQKIVMYLIYRLFPDTFTDSERILMIQDITPHHLYNEFTPRSPQNGDLIFAFRDRKLLADLSANTCRFPLWENVSSQFPTTTSLIWLFALDQTSCFLVTFRKLILSTLFRKSAVESPSIIFLLQ